MLRRGTTFAPSVPQYNDCEWQTNCRRSGYQGVRVKLRVGYNRISAFAPAAKI
jgi:hypothetical protein